MASNDKILVWDDDDDKICDLYLDIVESSRQNPHQNLTPLPQFGNIALNTSLPMNAVCCPRQPNVAAQPVSDHYRSSRDMQNRTQLLSADLNIQSHVPFENGYSIKDAAIQLPYASQNLDRLYQVTRMQSKLPNTNLPRYDHPLQHEVGSHTLNAVPPFNYHNSRSLSNGTTSYIIPETSSGEFNRERFMVDYANKENYQAQMKSPARPQSALHKCHQCDKVVTKGCYLTQHINAVHTGGKPFKCSRCGKRFADATSYEWHCAKHSDNKPFKCTECPKSFNHKSDLRRHMYLHSKYMPFSCVDCGKGFIRKDHMVKHCATHK